MLEVVILHGHQMASVAAVAAVVIRRALPVAEMVAAGGIMVAAVAV